VINIIPNTTIDNTAIVIKKILEILGSIIYAIIAEPNTTNGDLKKSLRVRLIPVCTWFTSDVILVIMLDVPILSISVNDNV
jgi:hypothetical protein